MTGDQHPVILEGAPRPPIEGFCGPERADPLMSGHIPDMSGTRTRARYARWVAAKALMVACVVLLCAFGAGPAAVAAAVPGPAATAAPRPAGGAEPAESDPGGADPEGRSAARSCARAIAPRRAPSPGTPVSASPRALALPRGPSAAEHGPAAERAARSVVLRC
ncbi:hypothetical protein [Streptomyces sp. G-G2]|uniref:hypothetical protein n=1 Tax=Streptomyces sp. G-G2 TaxID=3046201 RepID=UPI0024B8E14D|nr:hypothetical protein [Streptomyces sp. G-G2]MDJ0380693.1 hypothetical protein [Streptomyces sp. G-G2]